MAACSSGELCDVDPSYWIVQTMKRVLSPHAIPACQADFDLSQLTRPNEIDGPRCLGFK